VNYDLRMLVSFFVNSSSGHLFFLMELLQTSIESAVEICGKALNVLTNSTAFEGEPRVVLFGAITSALLAFLSITRKPTLLDLP
jgi:hypothetical protein